MRKILGSVLTAGLLTSISLAQAPAPANGPSESGNATVRIAPDTILRVELVKSIDAKKARVGDEVTGKTMDDFMSGNDVLAPKGSRVLAHVAEVSGRVGESASTLGIAFDKVVLKNGTAVPFKASIQAIGKPQATMASTNQPMASTNQPMAESGGGAARPMSAPGRDSYGAGYGGAMQGGGGDTNTSSANPSADSAAGELTRSAQGVVGMSGVSLSTGSADSSLLTSQKQNVKLDSGTQMVLRVTQ